MNNIHYGGRRIFEWHDNGTLWIYPENRFDTVINAQPTFTGAGTGASTAVYVQEAYYVQGQQPAGIGGANAYPGGTNVTVVQATVNPMGGQQPQQATVVPADAAYTPPNVKGDSNNL